MVGRPSVQKERQKQIMKAYVACVADYGLEGASLSLIAKKAGISRPSVRHHMGNKDDMIQQLVAHMVEEFLNVNKAIVAYLPATKRVDALLQMLFSEHYSDTEMVLAFASLTAYAKHDAETQKALVPCIVDYERIVTNELKNEYPNADAEMIKAIAQTIIAHSFNLDSLSPLGLSTEWRKSALLTINTLIKQLET